MKTKNTVKPYSHKYVDCNGMIVIATVDLKLYVSSALNPFPLAHFEENLQQTIFENNVTKEGGAYNEERLLLS